MHNPADIGYADTLLPMAILRGAADSASGTVTLSDSTGVTTPEEDYPGLTTVQQLIDYIAVHG